MRDSAFRQMNNALSIQGLFNNLWDLETDCVSDSDEKELDDFAADLLQVLCRIKANKRMKIAS